MIGDAIKLTPLYQDKDWLFDQYINKRKSIKTIAKDINVSRFPIYQWLHKFDIAFRPASIAAYQEKTDYKCESWLYDQYVNQGKSFEQIGTEQGVWASTVGDWARKFRIPVRDYTGENNPSCRPEVRAKHSGANCHWWAGGNSPECMKIRGSREYIHWRKSVYERDGYTCLKCDQWGRELTVHHQYSFAGYPELRLNKSNGVTLCKKCHRKFHKIFGKKYNRPAHVMKFLLDVLP